MQGTLKMQEFNAKEYFEKFQAGIEKQRRDKIHNQARRLRLEETRK
jgi:hypothetical protein